jgi:hypothetical protein
MVSKGSAAHFLFIGYAKSGRNGGCFGCVQRIKQTPVEALAKIYPPEFTTSQFVSVKDAD